MRLVLGDLVLGVDGAGRGGGRRERADVAERLEPADCLRVGLGLGRWFRRLPGRRLHARGQRRDLVGQPPGDVAPLRDGVLQLAAVYAQVVELGLRRGDVLPFPDAQRPQLAPREVKSRVPGFRVRRGNLAPGLASQQRHQALAVLPRLWRETRQRLDRRRQVDAAHLLANHARRQAGGPDDQRHLERRVVQEVPVVVLAVLTERLAVVRGHHEHRGRGVEARDERAERRVGVGHLAVVRPPAGQLQVLCRRLVGIVGIEQVHPGEPRLGRTGVEPSADRGDHVSGGALQFREGDRRGRGAPEVRVVEVEAAVEAVGRIENGAGDERRRAVPRGLQPRRDRRHGRRQRRQAVHPDAEPRRVAASQDGGV